MKIWVTYHNQTQHYNNIIMGGMTNSDVFKLFYILDIRFSGQLWRRGTKKKEAEVRLQTRQVVSSIPARGNI